MRWAVRGVLGVLRLWGVEDLGFESWTQRFIVWGFPGPYFVFQQFEGVRACGSQQCFFRVT